MYVQGGVGSQVVATDSGSAAGGVNGLGLSELLLTARGSGTEPKMKFYVFAQAKVSSAAELGAVKARAQQGLAEIMKHIEADARRRAES